MYAANHSQAAYANSNPSAYLASSGQHSYSASSAAYGFHGEFPTYSSQGYAKQAYAQQEQHNHSIVESFLAENRPATPMISNLGEIKPIVDQTFLALTGQDFPELGIKIVICDEAQFKLIYESMGGVYSRGIMGFSFNKYGKGVSEIYVKEEHMDQLLLTIGHEIGHVLSPSLINAQDEEAKAHAFSLAWMQTIRDNNIAGLEPNIAVSPAKNGLHDVAYNFVVHLLNTGSCAYDIFKTLAQGLTSIISQQVET